MNAVPDGWERVPTQAFGTLVGPFWRPPGDTQVAGFLTDERHGNKRGVTHGGMLATAFDVALGNACWAAAGQRPRAPVQQAGALRLGEFAVIRAEIIRTTSSLVFVRGVMSVADRPVATADGVWKILTWRGELPPSLGGPKA